MRFLTRILRIKMIYIILLKNKFLYFLSFEILSICQTFLKNHQIVPVYHFVKGFLSKPLHDISRVAAHDFFDFF